MLINEGGLDQLAAGMRSVYFCIVGTALAADGGAALRAAAWMGSRAGTQA